jgi:hypothetical protein
MWIELGKYLEPSSNDSLLAIDAAGKVPFFSGLRTLDMLGLNDRHIGKMTNVTSGAPGHEKFDPDYVLSRRPTFIAAWISPNMDMAWGLGLEKYGKMYSLRYLVNSTREHLGKANIVDVSFLEPAAIQALIRSGYSYGVLQKKKI